MLIGTLNHVKVKRLKKLLGKPLYCAMGVLESLWQLCMECCDEGNIGKFSNEEIADHIEWEGDPNLLISALTESGWLDTCSDERLIVHDWFAHCPEFIRKRIEKRKAREVKKSLKKEDQREIRTCDENIGDMSQDSETCPENPGHVSSISYPIVSDPITSHRKENSCPESPSKTHEQAGKKKSPKQSEIVFPEELLATRFPDVWLNWVKYKRERKESIASTTQEQAFAKAVRVGGNVVAAALEESMANGHQGWTYHLDKHIRSQNGGRDSPKKGYLPAFDFNESKTVHVPD